MIRAFTTICNWSSRHYRNFCDFLILQIRQTFFNFSQLPKNLDYRFCRINHFFRDQVQIGNQSVFQNFYRGFGHGCRGFVFVGEKLEQLNALVRFLQVFVGYTIFNTFKAQYISQIKYFYYTKTSVKPNQSYIFEILRFFEVKNFNLFFNKIYFILIFSTRNF